jgi:hypothetical protein
LQRCAHAQRALWQGYSVGSLLSGCNGHVGAGSRCANMKLEGLRVRRARAGELEAKDKLENMGLKKQQLFQAVEGLRDAAGE